MNDTIRVHIYIADVGVLRDSALFDHYYARMPAERRGKIDRMRFPKDKYLSLGAGILLQKACADAGIEGADGHLTLDQWQKPRFADVADLHFNLSHSEGRAMCALSDAEIGCDVEKIQTVPREILKTVLTDDERAWLDGQTDDAAFYRLWTLKESAMKAEGRGLMADPKRFSFDMRGNSPFLSEEYRLYDRTDAEYCYACCVRTRLSPKIDITTVDFIH